MPSYVVGYIFTRCFLQKRVELYAGLTLIPLAPTGSTDEIRIMRRLLDQSLFHFSRNMLERSMADLSQTGQSVLVRYSSVEALSYREAIESLEVDANAVAGALAVLSGNPVLPLCAFAKSNQDYGVKYFIPNDRLIRHGTNIHGFFDALPDMEKRAKTDSKFSLLLRLYRASLREAEIDNQILFQLILLEEASDTTAGDSFAERLRNYCQEQGVIGDFAAIADELGFTFPAGRDIVDVLVKLRNAAAHNGRIDSLSLKEYGGDWIIPLVENKERLHKLVGDVIRYMFCCLVGHNRERAPAKVEGGQTLEVRFD